MRRGASIAVCAALAGAMGLARPALAQSLPTATPFPAPSSPVPTGDQMMPFSGFTLASPIRLSLEGSISPVGGEFANCATLEDDAGNSVGGIPIQRYAEWRWTPRLVLSAFTQLGCPIDAGGGVAVTYAVPLRRSTSLVFGAGAYAAPGQFPLFGGAGSALSLALHGAPIAPVATSVRADVVWQDQHERSFHVGVQSLGPRHQQIVFGGGF